jgi:hypothetical protein
MTERIRVSYYPDMVTDDFSIPDAIVYQELEFWSQYAEKEHDGYKWFYKSHREIAERTRLTEKQVESCTKRLVESGVLIRIHHPHQGWNRTYWYRLANAMSDSVKCKPLSERMKPPLRENETSSQRESNPLSERMKPPLRENETSSEGGAITVDTPLQTPVETPSASGNRDSSTPARDALDTDPQNEKGGSENDQPKGKARRGVESRSRKRVKTRPVAQPTDEPEQEPAAKADKLAEIRARAKERSAARNGTG